MTWPCTGAASAASASSFGGSALGFFEPAFFLFLGMSESYAKIAAMVQERRTLDATAFALMLALTVDLRRSVVRDASRDPLDHPHGAAFCLGAIRADQRLAHVVFIYLTPALIALGLHFFVRGER